MAVACPQCRLVQDRAPTCRLCGGEPPLSVLEFPKRFFERRRVPAAIAVYESGAEGRATLFLLASAALVLCVSGAGIYVVLPLLAFAVFCVIPIDSTRTRPRLTVPARPPPLLCSSTTKVSGTTRRFRPHDDGPLVTTRIVLKEEQPVARTVAATTFVIILDDGEEVIVYGDAPLVEDPAPQAIDLAQALAAMDFPEDTQLDEQRAVESLIREGERVEVEGEAREEVVPELASFRTGSTRVFRGWPGSPVIVRKL